MPKLITLNELKEGMELAVPVRNKFSQVLLAENVKLEERHKKILNLWGINSIYIKDTEEEAEIKFSDEEIAAARELLKNRIRWNCRNYCEEDIFNVALEVLLKKTSRVK